MNHCHTKMNFLYRNFNYRVFNCLICNTITFKFDHKKRIDVDAEKERENAGVDEK